MQLNIVGVEKKSKKPCFSKKSDLIQKLKSVKGWNVMSCPSSKTPSQCHDIKASQTCWSLRFPCSKVSIKTCLLNDLPRRSFVTFLKVDSISIRAVEAKWNVWVFLMWSSWVLQRSKSISPSRFSDQLSLLGSHTEAASVTRYCQFGRQYLQFSGKCRNQVRQVDYKKPPLQV